MAGECPAVDVRWGGVDVLHHNGCYRRVRCCLRGGNCLTYPPALSIARILMPPSRTSRNFGVGRAVYGISDVDVPMAGYTPFLVGQSPQYGSQTYRSERMGGRPGPRSQHREQMTAPLLFVVGPKVATYRVQMRSPLLFEVGAEGGHL